MKFVATKKAEQLDLQALHRVRERLVGQRTGRRQSDSCLVGARRCGAPGAALPAQGIADHLGPAH
jgi:hypothetical protein